MRRQPSSGWPSLNKAGRRLMFTHAAGCVPQVAFKGYEEARVALTTLLFTIPCCIIIGVEYGVFMDGKLKTVSTHATWHQSSSG